jgi:hypothetical protein
VLLAAPPARADAIEGACLAVGRAAEQPALCNCIQRVADLMLSGADQRRAARFFADPHRAQEVRQSSRADDAAFWLRYIAFGEQAEALCKD